MKRLISADTSDILAFTPAELKQSIQASEGRVVCSENVTALVPQVTDITNAEIARAFGADLILLNFLDVERPYIHGLDETGDPVRRLRELVGRPVGINLEPVDTSATMLEDRQDVAPGRQAVPSSIQRAAELGADFLCLTGNPGSGVSNAQIAATVRLCKEHFDGLVIAGKMHGAGVGERVVDKQAVQEYLDAGADIILVPAVGSIPGFTQDELVDIVRTVQAGGGLVMTTIGTSQETSDPATIRRIAHDNKIAGADIQHIGDAGPGGLADPLNIYTLSETIRGRRHTISRMARSVRR
ncbi:MAG: hypothetical protein Q4G50_12120 [Corynebacterium sp.]|uniref:DUF7916 family protein n=1 Tax=Corynebacterium sp. TaxID=1720 RepID=UPI0026DEAB03|nr:hypothetical protein [Corynebacterium sp.]MDO5670730.1 hypothetical protein [Corynebacterium sp.]